MKHRLELTLERFAQKVNSRPAEVGGHTVPSRRMADLPFEQKLHGPRACILRVYDCIVCFVLCDIEGGGCGPSLFPFHSHRQQGSETCHQKTREQDLENGKDQGPGSLERL
jgi:hypothetical protein